MYIKSLIYEDQSTGWKLELMEFKPLTLLVGASGVGKTQILKALLNIKEISEGKSLNGLKWEIEFNTSSGRECKWFGSFENKSSKNEKDKSFINYEHLVINGHEIIERNQNTILFNNKETVRLSQQESAVFLLKEENQVKEIHADFNKIIFGNNTDNNKGFGIDVMEIDSLLTQYLSLQDIRNSDGNIKTKLYLLFINEKKSFQEIVDVFIDIFPYVEDVKIDSIENKTVLWHFFDGLFIHIKEKNILHWIDEINISSGMLRAFFSLAELHLCSDDSVLLIDEFENSLGINCIDQITHSILASERNLQFIITSHHPYIINNIGVSHWKIITRNGNVVTATDAEAFGIGQSKHQAFTQLINLDAYTDGIVN
ncbi:MAG: AAA family ATPase [Methylovulum miyakonense]|uniref:AAA family ATPase n=1 Tax=Methylovulum miyakonense TaxID=645578 RepID=UPI003BB5C063